MPKPRKGNGALLGLGSWSQKGSVVKCMMKDMVTRRVRATHRRVSRELGSRGLYSLVLSLHGRSDTLKNPAKSLSEGWSPAKQLVVLLQQKGGRAAARRVVMVKTRKGNKGPSG